jgi:hypothetical protein
MNSAHTTGAALHDAYARCGDFLSWPGFVPVIHVFNFAKQNVDARDV